MAFCPGRRSCYAGKTLRIVKESAEKQFASSMTLYTWRPTDTDGLSPLTIAETDGSGILALAGTVLFL
jgi:hypothetical protein